MIYGESYSVLPSFSAKCLHINIGKTLSLSFFFFFVLILLLNLNAEFQIIARRDKKAFLSEKCKEIEEKKKGMGKTRDLIKKD